MICVAGAYRVYYFRSSEKRTPRHVEICRRSTGASRCMQDDKAGVTYIKENGKGEKRKLCRKFYTVLDF